jgi:hypothetical protein
MYGFVGSQGATVSPPLRIDDVDHLVIRQCRDVCWYGYRWRCGLKPVARFLNAVEAPYIATCLSR